MNKYSWTLEEFRTQQKQQQMNYTEKIPRRLQKLMNLVGWTLFYSFLIALTLIVISKNLYNISYWLMMTVLVLHSVVASTIVYNYQKSRSLIQGDFSEFNTGKTIPIKSALIMFTIDLILLVPFVWCYVLVNP